MNKYNPHIHNRRSIRLKGYDYSQAGLYFITICCQDRICRFGHVENGEMILNEIGEIAYGEWIKTPEIRQNVELGEFVIMPNHMHGIIRLLGRGESHSPTTNELHSPTTNELHSPETSESHSPETSEPHSPETREPHSPETNELHSPETRESHSPETSEPHSPETGESHSPETSEPHSPETRESHSPEIEGVFKTPQRSPSNNIGAIVRGYKSSVTRQFGLLGFNEKLWQRNYYEHIIRNEKAFQTISEYIKNNPAKWVGDKFYMKRTAKS